MRNLRLQTSDGANVATVQVPSFPDNNLPEVVTWGTRTFRITPGVRALVQKAESDEGAIGSTEEIPIYREVFACTALGHTQVWRDK